MPSPDPRQVRSKRTAGARSTAVNLIASNDRVFCEEERLRTSKRQKWDQSAACCCAFGHQGKELQERLLATWNPTAETSASLQTLGNVTYPPQFQVLFLRLLRTLCGLNNVLRNV